MRVLDERGECGMLRQRPIDQLEHAKPPETLAARADWQGYQSSRQAEAEAASQPRE